MLLRGEIRRERLAAGETMRLIKAIRPRVASAAQSARRTRARVRQPGSAKAELSSCQATERLGSPWFLSCAWIALRVEDYRPSAGRRHHQVALESLAVTLGIAGGDIDYFLDLARMRHSTLYDAVVVAETDVEAAVAAAVDLSGKVAAWLEARGRL